MPTDAELDVLVAQAIKTLRERDEKIKFSAVQDIVKHRAEDVLKAYQRFFGFERAKKAAELQQVISPSVAEELLKDREKYAEDRMQLLNEEIAQLIDGTEALRDVIAELRRDLLSTEGQINSLDQENSHLTKTINTLRGEINVLEDDRVLARQEREDADSKRLRMQASFATKAEAERRERIRADKLQRRLDQALAQIKELESGKAAKSTK